MSDVPAYILAGGRSRRFGSDKARARLDGQPLIRRVADELAPWSSRVTVVARHEGQYADLGLHTIGDREPHRGPLGGLLTAMLDARQAGDAWLLLASCDLLEIRSQWIQALLAARNEASEVVAYARSPWQPMPALYRASLHEQAARQLARGEGSICRLIDGARARGLPQPADWPVLVQANTPTDLDLYCSVQRSP